jgi:hypothetical protein
MASSGAFSFIGDGYNMLSKNKNVIKLTGNLKTIRKFLNIFPISNPEDINDALKANSCEISISILTNKILYKKNKK